MKIKKAHQNNAVTNSQAPTSSEQNLTINLLRIIATLAVVAIHTTSRSLELTQMDIVHFPLLFAVNQLSRFAVPLFFLLSGYVLESTYDGKINIKLFFRKRLNRIFIPYLFWTAVYLFISGHLLTVLDYMKGLLLGEGTNHLYFIPAILILYFLFPFLHHFREKLLQKKIIVFIVSIGLLLLFTNYYFNMLTFLPVMLQAFVFNIYTFILGMFTAHKKRQLQLFTKKHLLIISIVLLLSVCIIILESWIFFTATHNSNFLYNQWRPSISLFTIMGTVLISFFLKHILNKFSILITKLSRLTFFVFLSHLLFFNLFWKYIGSALFAHFISHVWHTYILNIVIFITLSVFAFLIAYIISFIPKLSVFLGIAK